MTGQGALDFGASRPPSFRDDDFLVHPSNEASYRLLRNAPQGWTSHALILTGDEATGKTHLAHIFCETTGGALATPGDTGLLTALHDGTVKAVCLDDADRVAGHEANEVWLQHLYNSCQQTGALLALTARTPPVAWGVQLPDARSRLLAAPLVELQEPDDTLLTHMLVKQLGDEALRVEGDLIAPIVEKARTPRLIRAFITALAARHAPGKLTKAALDELLEKIGRLYQPLP